MAEVIWTNRAFGQLERAVKHIRDEPGLGYAEIVLKKVLETSEALEHHPKMGTIEPLLAHKKSTYRFLVVWSYKIIYRTTSKKVVISRIFHASRSPNV